VFAIIDREAQQQRSQQGQLEQSPGSGAQGSQPQTGTNQPLPSQQQGDEVAHRKSTMPHKGHSREIVPCQSRRSPFRGGNAPGNKIREGEGYLERLAPLFAGAEIVVG
jgi:hypothetical protein